MQEFAFELALCAALERPDRIVGRQLGASLHGGRVVDVVCVEPGPEFERRQAITPHTIPPLAVESDVGLGRATGVTDAFDCHPERARAVADRAVEIGFFERDPKDGHEALRRVARYPDWFDSLVGIENKPDLGRPGDLRDQLRIDVSLGLFDEVVLATESYVTGAHLNRLPDEVGVWRFDPATGEREVVREPEPLTPDEPGIELLDRDASGASVRPVTVAEKERQRRRIAERAYGKGWRTYDLPSCERCRPDEANSSACEGTESSELDATGVPWCAWKGEVVRPVTACGPDCDGFEPADSPALDLEAVRARRSAWKRDVDGVARQQAGLDRFSS